MSKGLHYQSTESQKNNCLLGKQRLPLITNEQIKSAILLDVVGCYSCFLIGALEIYTSFFDYPVYDWQAKNKQYINGNEGIKMVHVLKDSDFISKSQIDDKYQNVLQAVIHD